MTIVRKFRARTTVTNKHVIDICFHFGFLQYHYHIWNRDIVITCTTLDKRKWI
jgi:hypothetical protein